MLRNLDLKDIDHLKDELNNIEVATEGIDIMLPKAQPYLFKTDKISSSAAILLKEQMLDLGAECAIARDAVMNSNKKYPTILIGSKAHFDQLVQQLDTEGYPELSQLIEELKHFFATQAGSCLKIQDQSIDISNRTRIMGILNITPDSFSDGGRFDSPDSAIKAALKMEKQGADIIDIGGESTRPGAEPVSIEEEYKRVLPVIKGIRKKSDIPISIDTYKSKVAKKALSNGANIVNDISGLRFDSGMANTIARYDATVIMMHIQGEPRNMQDNPSYENLFDDILNYLETSIKIALDSGIAKDQIVLDPGIGFGKEWEANYRILQHLNEFKSLGYPLLIGPSRKSFIGNLLNLPPDQRLEGSLAAAVAGVMNGADIVRVHDVKETSRAIQVADKIIGKR
ncbi:MAG: dihydropteroate synthase [Candidatus Marinimicrobia bacterium]|nr:dihydropteroate synthase [Candidatus Neomarinimicrobiota bacterium]